MSSSSYASFAALSILQNPRKMTSKGYVFDASFCLGLPERKSIVASLRYFNAKDEVFPELGLYFVYTTVAHMHPSIEAFTGDESGSNYEPGDFSLLIFLGLPSETEIDYHQPPYVHICGSAFNVDVLTATYSVTAEQYTGTFRDLQKKQTGSLLSTVWIIPDSPRYENIKKPVPYNKHFVMVTGNITGMTSVLENDQVNDSFRISVDNVVFLGTYVPPATPAASGSRTPFAAKLFALLYMEIPIKFNLL
ncbi:hypothetical protein K438DRAFT_1771809 [Mycena galopus ATCC 62051]|nr:hypothetical protein K438DRAFT_1771809 [Mycena galopus ATCC 62051]